jgi:hypothetical protein
LPRNQLGAASVHPLLSLPAATTCRNGMKPARAADANSTPRKSQKRFLSSQFRPFQTPLLRGGHFSKGSIAGSAGTGTGSYKYFTLQSFGGRKGRCGWGEYVRWMIVGWNPSYSVAPHPADHGAWNEQSRRRWILARDALICPENHG